MRIILARHGDAKGAHDKFHGHTEEPLTSHGREETYELANDLKDEDIKVIYYCPLKRSAQTAQILSDELDIPMIEAEELIAWDLGDFTGTSLDDYTERVRYYIRHPEKIVPGGESLNDFAERYLTFFEEFFSNHSKDTIAFLTHGRNILITQAYIKEGAVAPQFDKYVLLDNKVTTEHSGYAIAQPPDKFEIIDKKVVVGGRS